MWIDTRQENVILRCIALLLGLILLHGTAVNDCLNNKKEHGENLAEVEQAVLVTKENVILNKKNEIQDTEKLDCKEEIANKNKEIAELKLEVAKCQEVLVEPFRVLESFSGSSSHLISKRESKPNPKVIIAAKNRSSSASKQSCISVSKFCAYPDQANSFVSTDSYIALSLSGGCLSKPCLTPDRVNPSPIIQPLLPTYSYIGTHNMSTVICFVVQKISPLRKSEASVVRFEEEVLNLGKSFNINDSVFVAPRTGIYEFTFNGYKEGNHTEPVLMVSLRLNSKEVLTAFSEDFIGDHPEAGIHNFRSSISMHSFLKLKKGDRIDLFKKEGTLHGNHNYHQIHFTGKLLFEGETQTDSSQQKTATRSLPVYFVLQKNADFSSSKSVIPFEVESLNIGESIDTKKEIFTTPVAGIYEFVVKGYKTVAEDSLTISLRVNGKAVANSWADYVGGHNFHTSFSIHCILQTEKGDSIDLFLEDGPLHGDNNHYTTFTGKLLFKIDQPETHLGERKSTDNKFQSPAVYFNVQKTASFSTVDAVIPFEKEVLNIGGAFDMKDNTFIAPRGGIYEFSFAGIKTGSSHYLVIALRLNGNPVAYAWADYAQRHTFFTPLSFHSILKVKKGDRVDLFLEEGELGTENKSDSQSIHLTGKLLFAEDVKA